MRPKTLLLHRWIDGRKIVVDGARLPGRVAPGLNDYVHMKDEGVDLLIKCPTLSKVTSGLLL